MQTELNTKGSVFAELDGTALTTRHTLLHTDVSPSALKRLHAHWHWRVAFLFAMHTHLYAIPVRHHTHDEHTPIRTKSTAAYTHIMHTHIYGIPRHAIRSGLIYTNAHSLIRFSFRFLDPANFTVYE